ncbi:MAG: cytochrome c [Verrucomicrobia bacterium]|nr:cytochrome c [Verrucomicrobiota bacterium]
MKMKMKASPLVSLISLIAGLACAADVQENWTKNCAACHGKDGKGETKAGKKAEVKDLTDATYQASFTDEQMFKQIKEGMKDQSGKEKMKAFAGKLTDEEIKALVTHVRSFKK